MIRNPMETGRAENAIEDRRKRQVLQVSHHELRTVAESRPQLLARCRCHVVRKIQRDYTATWQLFKQFCCESSRATAGIEDEFISTQPQTGKNLLSPGILWSRNTLVSGGIPLARFRHKLSSSFDC